jgi:hydrogenase/urease accessory protein HupE
MCFPVEERLVTKDAAPHVWIIAGVSLTIALVPATAEAHLVTTGLGPVYDGVWHVLVSPEDLVPILAMAMLAGLNGRAAGRRALFGMTSAWLVGGLAGYAVGEPVASMATTLSFLALGVFTAMDLRMSPRVVSVLAIVLGGLHGWLNGAGIAATQRDVTGLIGISAVTFVIVALVSAAVVSLRFAWMRIAVRVAGSWVAAIGLLMLGWSLRGTA